MEWSYGFCLISGFFRTSIKGKAIAPIKSLLNSFNAEATVSGELYTASSSSENIMSPLARRVPSFLLLISPAESEYESKRPSGKKFDHLAGAVGRPIVNDNDLWVRILGQRGFHR